MTTVTYDSIAETFTMTKGAWSNTCPISDLPKWLVFYRQQQVYSRAMPRATTTASRRSNTSPPLYMPQAGCEDEQTKG